MSMVQVEAQLSSDELLKAVEQLSLAELGRFVSQTFSLWVERQKLRLSPVERGLLRKIQQCLPDDSRKRYHELIERRQAETLTRKEYNELLRLTERAEEADVGRLEALVKLANLRKTSLSALMRDLGIQASHNG